MISVKRMKALLLALLMLGSMVLMTACGGSETAEGPTENASGEISYKVTVTDALGNPYTSGVIVRFLQNGEQAAMQPVDADGVAAKALPKGEYTVELMFTGNEDEYHYDQEGLTLTADAPELNVVLTYTMSQEATTLYAQGEERQAYQVNDGSTYVELVPGTRNYFLYSPTVAGSYAFSSDAAGAAIGYYGAPHFVQEMSAAEVVDNSFSISIRSSMIGEGNTGTTVVVIGIDADENTDSCILTVQRTGDPEWSVEDEPWTVYEPTVELVPYTLSGSVVEFDLTASTDTYNLVLGADGYYHLDSESGPLVLVHLTKDPEYLPCFKNILDRSGVNRYFYDENGEFLRKETYDQCLLAYFDYADEDSGLYPLTEDLKYIIQQRGEYSGWWDLDGQSYLFVDDAQNPIPGINNEIAWLFMCCYIAQ